MARINITETGEDGSIRLAGWFDPRRSMAYEQGTYWDGNNRRGVITRSQWVDETLYRTPGGRWIIHHDATRYHNGGDSYRFVSGAEARDWLIRSEMNDAALAEHFGPLPEEASGGRPAIGGQIKVAMTPEMVTAIDEAADDLGVSRAEWIRQACSGRLAATIMIP